MPTPPPPLTLAMHGVAAVAYDADPHRLFVSPRTIERHVRWLRRRGYELTTFGVLASRVAAGRGGGTAALTFDDGFADNLHTLVPILAGEGVPATVFVVSGWLGGHHPDAPSVPMLTTDDLRTLDAAGIEIGVHTHTHPSLPALADDEIHREWTESRQVLAEALDHDVVVGAYPYGAADERVRVATQQAGLVACCRTEGAGRWTEPLDLPRQAVSHGASTLSLPLKQANRYERVMSIRGLRAARRLQRRATSWRDARSAPPDRRT